MSKKPVKKKKPKRRDTLYIAGPMRGIVHYNFDAFMEAQKILEENGYRSKNPAAEDHLDGFNPYALPDDHDWSKWPESHLTFINVVRRDVDMLIDSDGILLLDGWQRSRGALAEASLALWLKLPAYRIDYNNRRIFGHILSIDIPHPIIDADIATESILSEAQRITSGDRQNQYGPPDQDFRRTADMWSGLFQDMLKPDCQFEPYHVALAMILLKASRELHQAKRDNAVDIAGYAHCLNICRRENTDV